MTLERPARVGRFNADLISEIRTFEKRDATRMTTLDRPAGAGRSNADLILEIRTFGKPDITRMTLDRPAV